MKRPHVHEVVVKVVVLEADYAYAENYIAQRGWDSAGRYVEDELGQGDLHSDNIVSTEVIGIWTTRPISDEEAKDMGIDLKEP